MNSIAKKTMALIAVMLMCMTPLMPMLDLSPSEASDEKTYTVEIQNKFSFKTKMVIEKNSAVVLEQTLDNNDVAKLENASGTYTFKVYKLVDDGDPVLLDTRSATLSSDIDVNYGGNITPKDSGIKAQSGQYKVTYESYNPYFQTTDKVHTVDGDEASEKNIDTMIFTYNSDTITADVIPVGDIPYAEYVGCKTGSGNLNLYMNESRDRSIKVFDNVTLEVGMKIAHFRDFKNIEPKSVTDNNDGTKTYVFALAKNENAAATTAQAYGINAYGGNYVTMGMKITYGNDDSMDMLDLTADGLMKVEGKTNKTTKDTWESSADIADIYGNDNYTGWITMKNGTTERVNTYRVFQTIESPITNFYIEPKKNYAVVSGDSVTVDDLGNITAVKNGTSVISVWCDAMNFLVVNSSTIGTPKFFPATSPDNAFVLVVTVNDDGKSPTVDTGIKVNEGLNDTSVKISGDYVDSDVDIFYYYKGTEGYRYTFTPASGSKVTVMNPTLDGNTVTGFKEGSVTDNGDSFTVLLKDGRNFIKIVNGNDTVYQVIRAKEIPITVENTTSEERGKEGKVLPGDVIKVTLKKITGLQKMAGVYNPTSSLVVVDDHRTKTTVKCTQYQMGVADIVFQLTVPADVSGTFSFYGYVNDTGWGDPTGAHHLLDNNVGKQANFDAKLRAMFNSHLDTYTLKVKGDCIVNYHDGSATEKIVVKVGEKLTQPEVPSVSGKMFCGWHVGSAEGAIWNFNDVVNDDLELYAEWVDVKKDEPVIVKADESGKTEIDIPAGQTMEELVIVATNTAVTFTGSDLASLAGHKVVMKIADTHPATRIGSVANGGEDIGKYGGGFNISLTVDGQKSSLKYDVVRSYDADKGMPAIYMLDGSKYVKMDSKVNALNHKISFTADKDASYELRYTDAPVPDPEPEKGTDGTLIVGIIVLVAIVAILLALVAKYRM